MSFFYSSTSVSFMPQSGNEGILLLLLQYNLTIHLLFKGILHIVAALMSLLFVYFLHVHASGMTAAGTP